MEKEILEVEKERQEIIKRIQEKERLISLLQSKYVKGGIKEIKEFHDNYNKRKNEPQKESLEKSTKEQLEDINQESNDKDLANIKFNSFQHGLNYITMIKRVQRAFRNYILKKNKRKLRNYYLNKLIQEFNKPIDLERGAELRKIMVQKLKQWNAPEADFEDIINRYYDEYRDFSFNFPLREQIRENNFFTYYQCLDMMKYLESINPETALNDCNKFRQFMLDKNKEYSTKFVVDDMEKKYKLKNDVYQFNVIDEFEENNLLDEIDNRYNFEPRSSILNKKP